MSSDKPWEQVLAELWPTPTVAEKIAEVESICVKLMNALKPVTAGGGSSQASNVKMRPVPVFNKNGTVDCLVQMLPADSVPELPKKYEGSEPVSLGPFFPPEEIAKYTAENALVTSPFITPDVPNRNADVITKAALEKAVEKEAESKPTPTADTKREEAPKPAIPIVISNNESLEIYFHFENLLDRVHRLSTDLGLLLHVASAYRNSNPWTTGQIVELRHAEDVKVVRQLSAALVTLNNQVLDGIKPVTDLSKKILDTMPGCYIAEGATRFAKQLKEEHGRRM